MAQDVISRGRVPLVVGGTGLYLRTLIHGPTGAPSSTPESRDSMDRMLEGETWETRYPHCRTPPSFCHLYCKQHKAAWGL